MDSEEAMFCPKCATQNIDGASFCRVCGANISLVVQALSGQPVAVADDSRAARRSRMRCGSKPSIDGAVTTAFAGLAFFVVSMVLAFSEAGNGWWFWMLIPAFSCLGSGIAQYLRYQEERKKSVSLPVSNQPSLDTPRQGFALSPRPTSELMVSPPSVIEGTTRHLGAETPTRNLDFANDGKAAEPEFSFRRT
jgi:hypothetical protein